MTDLQSVPGNAQASGEQATYDAEPECLGALLGALRAESPDLARVVAAWPTLPEPVRAGIVAMIEAL